MNQFLSGAMRAVSESFHLPEPILEIGSCQVEGQSASNDLRGLFPGKAYTGVDFRPGPGVDCVANVEALPQKDASVGTVIALSTFEHVQRFWLGFSEIERVLRPDGVFILSGPTENALYRLGRRLAGFDGHYHVQTIYDIERQAEASFQRQARSLQPAGIPLFALSAWRIRPS